MPPTVVYVPEKAPDSYKKSIFLAGPSPRGQEHANWRSEALNILDRMGYDGVVFVPLTNNTEWKHAYDAQIDWELKYLHQADRIVFWVPRSADLPGYTTNVEFGYFAKSHRVDLGYPPGTDHTRYLGNLAVRHDIPQFNTLEDTLTSAVAAIGEGSERIGGETNVPLHLWQTLMFQEWLNAQKARGNRLVSAKSLWEFGRQTDDGRFSVFSFALQVAVHVVAENRIKSNEFILSRPSISVVAVFGQPPGGRWIDTPVVLVREFRSPVNNTQGFVFELPGGSTSKPGTTPIGVAVQELCEETGLKIPVDRLHFMGARQLCATLTTHRAHLYAVQLTEEEMADVNKAVKEARLFGNAAETERVTLCCTTLKEIIRGRTHLDWSMTGMILQAAQDYVVLARLGFDALSAPNIVVGFGASTGFGSVRGVYLAGQGSRQVGHQKPLVCIEAPCLDAP